MEKETFFISGLDDSVKESDLQEYFINEIQGEFSLKIHSFSFLKYSFLLGEIKVPFNQGLNIYQTFSNFKIKSLNLRLIPKSSMKTIIVTNLPVYVSEKDLFLILLRLTPGLKRIIIPENSDTIGETFGMAIAHYITHEHASHALESLEKCNNIFQRKVQACWKEPYMDFLSDLSKETRTIYIKNLSFGLGIEELHSVLSQYGEIKKISKYATKAYVEYGEINMAQKAMNDLNDKFIKGTFWRVFPAKVFDKDRYKEKSDKNQTFSKNFLEEAEQEKLSRYLLSTSPEDRKEEYQIKSKSILESVRQSLFSQVESLKKQCSTLKSECSETH